MFPPFIIISLLSLAPRPPLVLQVDLVLQGHVHCAERVHPQYNGTVVALPTNEGAGPASQVRTARSDQALAVPTNIKSFVYREFICPKSEYDLGCFHNQLWV
jgi:hypothetical protein